MIGVGAGACTWIVWPGTAPGGTCTFIVPTVYISIHQYQCQVGWGSGVNIKKVGRD